MLTKLSLAGVRSRFKDYLVLLTGLVMSAAIFYMFMNLATNKAFIKSNTTIAMASQVFVFGMILLAMITVVYIGYANSFLLKMRQRDYGLFMMLGAKKQRIGQLIGLETLIIGVLSTALGVVIGIGASSVVAGMLFHQLGLTVHHFTALYWPAVIGTGCLYIGLFILAAAFNLIKLLRTPVLALLHADERVTVSRIRPVLLVIESIAGILLLAVGYWAFTAIRQLQINAIFVALITITSGSYFVIHAGSVSVLAGLKRTSFASHQLHNFTLAQIRFRLQSYTRMLTVVSLLFAMALGALSVGTGLHKQSGTMAVSTSAYTVAVNNPNSRERQLIKQLHVAHKATYTQKVVGNTVFYNEQEFRDQPFEQLVSSKPKNDGSVKALSLAQMKRQGLTDLDFIGLTATGMQQKRQIVSASAFNKLTATPQTVTTVRVSDLLADRVALSHLNKEQQRRYPTSAGMSAGAYAAYDMFNTLFSGLEFMGLFLGIAFLAMLASCLMFKILSGATDDVIRYNMLNRIGVRQQTMRHAIRSELLVLYLIPGILGMIDVLFGLQLFKPLMYHPYASTGWAMLIFWILYGGYYLITVWLYERIVVPEEQLAA
ncbi:FtsX-like permease family protein [Furfurilactobacillus entadae]|uniref:FtsX-like permease family protein n=1 Tax=Furfurilactobacillus entadae TaxID=2922307 RepID=UPI0035EB177C